MLDNSHIIYVLDTNILVDYPDIISSGEDKEYRPESPTIDLSAAHLVIPTVVIRELSNFKKEKSERGKAARAVLKRLRELVENQVCPMSKIYKGDKDAEIKVGKQTLTILPVHKNFKNALPFSPSEDDMDGQIILAALTVLFRKRNHPIDGTATEAQIAGLNPENVVLLTNDNGLAIRARQRGLYASRYGHKYPDPYTGRRDVMVPAGIFEEFYKRKYLSREDFEIALPKEPRLIANEFIVMKSASPETYPCGYNPNGPSFDHIGRYDAKEDAIVPLKYVSEFPVCPRNAGQAIYAEALMNPDFAAVICTGPAGSGKTFMATVFGYTACLKGQFIGVTVVPCENQGRLGALPGDLDEKMDPDVQPLKNALRNYILNKDEKLKEELEEFKLYGAAGKPEEPEEEPAEASESPEAAAENKKKNKRKKAKKKPVKEPVRIRLEREVKMIWRNWFSSIPIDNARGRDFSYELAIYDEFQDQNISQADTLIKRIGNNGKIILTGDVWQIHAPYLDVNNNGLVYASAQLFDHPMVAQVCFTEEEVIRHPLVRMVA
ncbi:MAG: PhoH family protein, partial [Candidatus Saccharibacteria bacterium]|nr:PhoH family protein [Candidatus Saccharibacteria bacterium]